MEEGRRTMPQSKGRRHSLPQDPASPGVTAQQSCGDPEPAGARYPPNGLCGLEGPLASAERSLGKGQGESKAAGRGHPEGRQGTREPTPGPLLHPLGPSAKVRPGGVPLCLVPGLKEDACAEDSASQGQ